MIPDKGGNQDTYFIVEKEFNGNDQEKFQKFSKISGRQPSALFTLRTTKAVNVCCKSKWPSGGLKTLKGSWFGRRTIPISFKLHHLEDSHDLYSKYFANLGTIFWPIFGRFRSFFADSRNSKSSWFTWDSDWCHFESNFLIYGSRDYSLISHIWPWNELEKSLEQFKSRSLDSLKV